VEALQKMIEKGSFLGKNGLVEKGYLKLVQIQPKNENILMQYAIFLVSSGKNAKAEPVLAQTLKIKDVPEANALLGFIKKDSGDYEKAIPLLEKAIATKDTNVIKKHQYWFAIGHCLQRLHRDKEAYDYYTEAAKVGVFPSAYQRGVDYQPNWQLRAHPYWNVNDTSPRIQELVRLLRKNWKIIRNEALAVMNDKGFLPEEEGLKEKGNWKQYTLFQHTQKFNKNCLKTLKTCELIEQFPEASNHKRGQTKFSLMEGGTHVWSHTGPTFTRLRIHLGLVIPNGAKMRVGPKTKTWKEGKVLIFDDSFEHEVWHEGTEKRIILIVDVWHPDLTPQQISSLERFN